MRLGVIAAVVAAFMGQAAAAKEWTEINIGVEGAFPPYNTMSSDGKLSGYDIDIANEVCKRAKLKCNLIAQDWDNQIPGLLAGKFDAVLTMGPNPKRREVIDFTVPYAQTSNTFGVLKSGPLANLPNNGQQLSVNDPDGKTALEALKAALKGKTVGVALSTSQQQFVEEAFKGIVEVRTYKTSEQHTLDLTAGRIDAVFDNIVYLRDAVERPGNQDVTMAGPLMKGSVMATDTCIGVRKGDPELRAKLDEAIRSAIADGTVKTLAMKWFKADVSPKL
jgi:lysine-arginine-ornithine-binding protein